MNIGITGQSGFVGTHLYNTLGLNPEKYQRIPFQDDFFQDETLLNDFVSQCDVIVHLAALNRHNDPNVIYETNIKLVKQLIKACEVTKSTPHIIFSSSTQEEKDNLYGKSKKEGRKLFEKWADKNDGQFTGLIIPNVFGPFGNPYYNSVIATFCHQLTHNETPKIDNDSTVKLIYVGELVKHIINLMEDVYTKHQNEVIINEVTVGHNTECKVSQLLEILNSYKQKYLLSGEIPAFPTPFYRDLFNTFVCYIDHSTFFPYNLKSNTDNRGSFTEVIKLNTGGQVSFSTTLPGISRGNHFHTRKAERFAVIKGKAKIELRRIGSNKILTFEVDGGKPSFVDMPIWYTHKITNTGLEDLYTIFWINEHFNAYDTDTFSINV